MSDESIEIRPDNARFMAAILLPIGVGWLVLGWSIRFVELSVDPAIFSRIAFSLAFFFILAGLLGFDGAISISSDQIRQRRLFRTRSLPFNEIEGLRYTANKQACSLLIGGSDVTISMSSVGFDRSTILRVRRIILERSPNVAHNPIPSDDRRCV